MEYNVGQLGTEPTAQLFGMEYSYPVGYDGNVYINGDNAILTLNDLMYKMEQQNKEIIIVGGQSQVVWYGGDNLAYIPISQGEFLLGTNPDVTILCINTYDDMDYIKRSIMYLESVIPSKVIALVISPVKQSLVHSELTRNTKTVNPEEMEYFKKSVSEMLNINTFLLDKEEDVRELFKKCIEEFC